MLLTWSFLNFGGFSPSIIYFSYKILNIQGRQKLRTCQTRNCLPQISREKMLRNKIWQFKNYFFFTHLSTKRGKCVNKKYFISMHFCLFFTHFFISVFNQFLLKYFMLILTFKCWIYYNLVYNPFNLLCYDIFYLCKKNTSSVLQTRFQWVKRASS